MNDPTPRLIISRRSGKVRVVADAGVPVSVEGGTLESNDDGSLEIHSPAQPTLEVRCPTGSDLSISTASGAIEVRGEVGSVRVTTKSGNLEIERASAIDARGASGKVDVGACSGECHVVFVSGKVHIGEAGKVVVATVSGNIDAEEVDDAEVKTVSGDIELGARGGGHLSAVDLGLGEDLGARRRSTGDAPEVGVGSDQLRVRPGRRRRDQRQDRQRRNRGDMPVTTTLAGTIVFTDIVGFTQLTDEHGDDLALTLLERQEQLVRRTLPDTARVVKELGDGLFCGSTTRARRSPRASFSSGRSRTSPTATCPCGCASACTGVARARAATTSSAAT